VSWRLLQQGQSRLRSIADAAVSQLCVEAIEFITAGRGLRQNGQLCVADLQVAGVDTDLVHGVGDGHHDVTSDGGDRAVDRAVTCAGSSLPVVAILPGAAVVGGGEQVVWERRRERRRERCGVACGV
jgi:hypothetical protein